MSFESEAARTFASRLQQAHESGPYADCGSPVNTGLSRLAEDENGRNNDLLAVYTALMKSPMFGLIMDEYRTGVAVNPLSPVARHQELMLLCARMFAAGQCAQKVNV